MDQKYDVVIVGAGLVGASFALHLARSTDLNIAVFERSSALKINSLPNQKVVALGAVATDVLTDIGVMPLLDSSSCHAYQGMVVWDENSNGVLSFSAQEHGYAQLGHMIDSNQCCLLLHQALANSPSVDTYFDSELIDIEFMQSGVSLETRDGRFNAQLIVAADGQQSWVRRQAKIFVNHHAYDQKGIVARIRGSQEHKDMAWQRFLSTGPVAALPLNEEQSSIVWSANTDFSKQLMEMSDAEFEIALARALESKLGKIELLSERQAFPLRSQRAETYIKRNLVLLGDAAHSIHPLAGQGANLGFKDLICLSELLSSVSPDRIGDLNVLQRYQRKRKFDNEQTDQMMSALHDAYQNNNPAWITARGLGMNLIGGSRGLKKLLAQQAIGS